MIARVAGLALLVPLAFALTTDDIAVPLRLFFVALWIFAAARPHAALVALTLLAPVGSSLFAVGGATPLRYGEALALVTLSGTLVAFSRPPLTTLRPQRPGVVAPAIIVCALMGASAASAVSGMRAQVPLLRGPAMYLWRDSLVGPVSEFAALASALLLLEGTVLMIVVARHARDSVRRPAQLIAATALAGAVAAVFQLATFVPIAVHASPFFLMTAFVAIALAMNRRHERAPRYPRAARALWIGAAALMVVSLWVAAVRGAPAAATHDAVRVAGPLQLVVLAALVWMLGVMTIRLAHGLRADSGDRLLLGSAAALAAFLAIWITSDPSLVAEIAFPFWILAGAALTRADGNAQPPYAASRGSID